LIYGKSCHLPDELEHKTYWALKLVNLDPKVVGEKRKIQLHEHEEMTFNAYQSSKLYKKCVKAYHDKKILKRNFHPGQSVLLFNYNFRLFPRKLKSKWSNPFLVKEVKSYGVVELEDLELHKNWVVNAQRLKPYLGGDIERFTTVIK